jgi:hypothetical protein
MLLTMSYTVKDTSGSCQREDRDVPGSSSRYNLRTLATTGASYSARISFCGAFPSFTLARSSCVFPSGTLANHTPFRVSSSSNPAYPVVSRAIQGRTFVEVHEDSTDKIWNSFVVCTSTQFDINTECLVWLVKLNRKYLLQSCNSFRK